MMIIVSNFVLILKSYATLPILVIHVDFEYNSYGYSYHFILLNDNFKYNSYGFNDDEVY